MWMITQPRGAVLAVLVAGAVFGACTSSPSRSTSPSTTATPTSTSTSTAPTSTTLLTTTCQPSQLHIVPSGSEGAAGTHEVTFSFTNDSTTLCMMRGYPGMLLLDATGGVLPTIVNRGGGLAFENVAVTDVALAPGQTAYFNLGFNDIVTGTTTCSMASQVEITPPNDTVHAVVPVFPSIVACGGGTLNVSPVFASTDSAAIQTTAPS
jgi:hypothetical protein